MPSRNTRDPAYSERLDRLESVWWKRLLDVQRPYRWSLRRLELGFVLDLGCGRGRSLVNLGGRTAGVGVDHNPDSVAACARRGLLAFTPEGFRASEYARPGRFDALLFAHVAEHMTWGEAKTLLLAYLPFVRTGGRVVIICPQEAGFSSDDTHVEFMDFSALDRLVRAAGLEPISEHSFPLPRLLGRLFKYNEFVAVARKP